MLRHRFMVMAFLFFGMIPTASYSRDLEISLVGAKSALNEADLKKIKTHDVKIVDALESNASKKVTAEYNGYKVNDVFDQAFGGRDKWSKADAVLFECADGYKAKVPTSLFLKHTGYLVFARKGDPSFSLVNYTQAAKKVKLAPYYLVWDDVRMQNVASTIYWPYQIVGLDLVGDGY